MHPTFVEFLEGATKYHADARLSSNPPANPGQVDIDVFPTQDEEKKGHLIGTRYILYGEQPLLSFLPDANMTPVWKGTTADMQTMLTWKVTAKLGGVEKELTESGPLPKRNARMGSGMIHPDPRSPLIRTPPRRAGTQYSPYARASPFDTPYLLISLFLSAKKNPSNA